MTSTCLHCSAPFEVTQTDLDFYTKVSPQISGKRYDIPPPKLCPDCRQQRRLAWRNERHLYHRKCELTGKSVITNFGEHTGIHVYDAHEWWTDKWDPLSYGRPFDFSRPFFEQYAELQSVVPQLSLSVWNSENADYCNYIGNVKGSYLIFGSVYSENCYYGSPYYSRNCVDTLVVRECESCYECVDCRKLNRCFYCQDCWHSNDLSFCFDCQGCSDCIGCAGLRKKQYCIFNEQLTKEEYLRKKAELDLCHPEARTLLKAKIQELRLSIPHRYMQSGQVEDVSGNYVYESKNVLQSFYADRSHDCKYCAQVVDLKDCYDNNYTEENELCCDYLGAYQVSRVCFSKFCNKVSDSFYCDACHQGSSNLFGCIGLRRAKYCVLNKQYTKEEYEKLVPKIIEHMKKTREYGEFFPIKQSPFSYNESVAQEYFPVEKKEALKHDWGWHVDDQKEKYLGPIVEVSNNIDQVGDDFCEKILICEVTGRPYKIIPQELAFYREMKLPVPRVCPDQRHLNRLAMRNPRKLWDRKCGKCSKPIATSYSPERTEQIYCDECYLSSVY
ncbi:hypothetical protein A3C37_02720 [Candidatus Peribacteria bacterium RIFCSPHIGHO2_02_FULL_53_20]|nr:MAG: hypothetical protein A3C37_02720 [Candidatus Peribacteria bacterium RIFCSPHIGHO2_02_FULL_53_20]OGJ70049.1 MAG: hypothetical protein A3G69_02800 [Candidatus Peribacteria bacterium RIFCSPLOWO2_12_FULL_53_10]HLC66454.1 hypothetical protein [Candidatus Nanoarchaeia archaeon]